MIKDLMYIELKTGYSDDGPAWIGYVKTSKTKKTIYFHDHAFQKYNGSYANYVDIENGDEYWISGLKKKKEQPPLGWAWENYDRSQSGCRISCSDRRERIAAKSVPNCGYRGQIPGGKNQ